MIIEYYFFKLGHFSYYRLNVVLGVNNYQRSSRLIDIRGTCGRIRLEMLHHKDCSDPISKRFPNVFGRYGSHHLLR